MLEMYLTIVKEMGDREREGIACGNIGTCFGNLGQYDKAIEYLGKRVTIAKEIGDKEGEGTTYGLLGSCYSSLGQYNKAIKYHEMHLAITKKIEDKTGEEIAYGKLGDCFNSLGQYSNAIKHYQVYLTISKQIRDKQGEKAAHGNLGVCFYKLCQYGKAIQHFEILLTIAKETGDQQEERTAHIMLGTCYSSLGQYDKAIRHHELHLTIAKKIGDQQDDGVAHFGLGTCYSYLGHWYKAIKHFEMCLTITKEIGLKESEGQAYNNLGTCYTNLAQYSKAFECLEISLAIAKEIGDKKGEIAAYGNLGCSYSPMGQYNKAIQHHEMSLTIAKETGDKKGEGVAYGNIGTCYTSLGQFERALEYLEMHLNIARETKDKEGEGVACGNIGTCFNYLGDYITAINYLKKRFTLAKENGDKKGEGAAYGNLGTSYIALGQYRKAIRYIEMHLIIAKEIKDKQGEGGAYGKLGACYCSLGQYEQAESDLRKGVKCYDELFENVPKWDESKVSVIDTFIYIYKFLIFTLFKQERMDGALIIAEKGRSRALVDLMLNTHSVENAAITKACRVSDLREIRKMIKDLGNTVLFFASIVPDINTWIIQPNGSIMFQKHSTEVPQQSNKIYMKKDFVCFNKLLQSLITKSVELMRSCTTVRCEDRSLSFLYSDELPSLTSKTIEPILVRLVKPDDLCALQPATSQTGVTQDGTIETAGAVSRTAGSAINEETADISSDHAEPKESMLTCLLKDLYQILLKPVRQYVVGSQVIVVPEGPLALVPFAALLDTNGNYLSDSLQVRLIPSLTIAKIIRDRPEEPALTGQGIPLIIGDPNVGTVKRGGEVITVPRLPCAREEVKVVGRFLNAKPLLGKRATKENFLRKVESASLIHIAAHGHAERGEILLAPSPGTTETNMEDIMLTLADLEGKRIKAKLVVLSCCHSGRGKVTGEGVVGIARAFLGAGARAVLVTLWVVDDGATLCLMSNFYKHLVCGESANEALNEAMRATREFVKEVANEAPDGTTKQVKVFRHPRYWAPFVLLGEDVTLFRK